MKKTTSKSIMIFTMLFFLIMISLSSWKLHGETSSTELDENVPRQDVSHETSKVDNTNSKDNVSHETSKVDNTNSKDNVSHETSKVDNTNSKDIVSHETSTSSQTADDDFIEDQRCKSGYGIPKKVINKESLFFDKWNTDVDEIKSQISILNEQKNKEIGKLNGKDKKIKSKIDALNKKYNEKFRNLNDKLKWQNFLKKQQDIKSSKEMCYLIDMSRVKYEQYSNELPNAKSYLLINEDTDAIVAEKNSKLQENADDFIKFYFLSMINYQIKHQNLDPNYLVKVDSNVYDVQSNQAYSSVGLKVGKSYKLIDLYKLIKYKSYDDVLFVIINDLYEGSKDAATKLNDYLQHIVKLKNTKIDSFFDPKNSGKNVTSAYDVIRFLKYIKINDYKNLYDIKYNDSLESLTSTKSVNMDGTMMDKNSNWYYSGLKEYWTSSLRNNNVSGLFDIRKLKQHYTLIVFDVQSRDALYAGITKLFRNAVNYKYSNILLARNDDDSMNSIFQTLGISRIYQVRHSADKSRPLKLVLGTSFSVNMPENYLQYMKVSIKLKFDKFYAPLKKNEIIGKMIFDDSKNKKINKFGGGHKFYLNLFSNAEIQRKNIFKSIFDSIVTFFEKWINATSEIKEND